MNRLSRFSDEELEFAKRMYERSIPYIDKEFPDSWDGLTHSQKFNLTLFAVGIIASHYKNVLAD